MALAGAKLFLASDDSSFVKAHGGHNATGPDQSMLFFNDAKTADIEILLRPGPIRLVAQAAIKQKVPRSSMPCRWGWRC